MRLVKCIMTSGQDLQRRGTVLLIVAALFARTVLADVPDYQHGISLLHELKYPADFEHFDYAGP